MKYFHHPPVTLLAALILLMLVLSSCGRAVNANPTPSALPILPATLTPATQFAPSTAGQPTNIQTVEKTPRLGELEKITLENVNQLEMLAQVGEGIFYDEIQVSPNGTVLAVATAGGILLVDAGNGQRLSFLPTPNAVDSLAFSPDGKHLAAVHREPGAEVMTTGDTAGLPIYSPILSIYDLASGNLTLSLNLSGRGCGQYAAWDLAYSPDGETLAFRDYYSWLGHDRTDNLCLLSATDGSLLRAIPVNLPWETASPVLFSPDGQRLFVSVVDQTTAGYTTPVTQVHVYEASTGSLIQEFDGLGVIYNMALSQDGERLALATQQGARLLSAKDGSRLVEFGSHTREVRSVAFSLDGTKLALGSLDGTVSVWVVPEGNPLWQAPAWSHASTLASEAFEAEIWDLAFTPDGEVLFALAPTHLVDTPGRVSAWQVFSGQELYSVYGNNGDSQPAVSPDGTRLTFGGYEDGRTQVRSVIQNRLLFELTGHTGLVLAARFSPDGGQIATASLDGSVRLWQAEDGSPQVTLSGHTGPVRTILYAPDGSQLLSIGDDATLRLWDPVNGTLLKSIPTQTGQWLAHSMVFSPDGKSVLLATGCPYANCPGQGQGDLRRVDLESGEITTLFAQPVYSVSFSADLRSLAMYSPQGIQTGQATGRQYQAGITYASPMGNGALAGTAISPDGALFFSGNGFGLHAWNAASGEMSAVFQGGSSSYGDIWVTPDQRMVLIASWNGLVSFWGVPHDQ